MADVRGASAVLVGEYSRQWSGYYGWAVDGGIHDLNFIWLVANCLGCCVWRMAAIHQTRLKCAVCKSSGEYWTTCGTYRSLSGVRGCSAGSAGDRQLGGLLYMWQA